MDLISLLITLVVIAIIWGLVVKYIPIPEPFRAAIHIVAVLIVIVVLLSFLGFDNFRFRG